MPLLQKFMHYLSDEEASSLEDGPQRTSGMNSSVLVLSSVNTEMTDRYHLARAARRKKTDDG